MRIILTANGSRRVEEDTTRERKKVLYVLYFYSDYFLFLEILKGTIELLSKHVYEVGRLCILDFTN